jgi:hypothetical protein
MTAGTAIEPETKKNPDAVKLRTRKDVTLTLQALEFRKDELEKLAKKNEDGGYGNAAREQRADAGAIENFILPQFRGQQELPLVTVEKLRDAISKALRPTVHRKLTALSSFSNSGQPSFGQPLKEAKEEAKQRQTDLFRSYEDELLSDLALQVERFATALAERAFNSGVAARENTPEGLSYASVDALYRE